MSRGRKRRSLGTDETLGCVIQLLLIIFLMPLAGIWLLSKSDPNAKAGGIALLVIGVLLWILVGLA